MLPIQKDNELICRNCGCVLSENEESHIDVQTSYEFLGSLLKTNSSIPYHKSPQQYYEEKAWMNLLTMKEKYGLPENVIQEVFRLLKKKNHLRSQKQPIKSILHLLDKDDYYLLWNKAKQIRKDYEEIFS